MKISEEALAHLEDIGVSVSAVDIVEEYADKSGYRVFCAENGLHYIHSAVGRNTIWIGYAETDGERELRDCYTHRMSIRDEYAGKSVQRAEGPAPAATHCECCNRELAESRVFLRYLCYPFVLALPRCPQCGQVFLTPEIMRKKVAPVEKNLEDK